VNRAVCAIVGFTPEQLLTRTFQDITHPDDLGHDIENLGAMISGRTSRYQSEKRYLHRDGHTVWVNLTVSLMRDAAGRPRNFVSQIEDITERKRLEESLAHARDQALEASRLKSEFLATMSHEIRTPLNGILGMAEVLRETTLTGEQREMADVLTGSAETLVGIVNDILDFSKIEAGKFRLERSDFELRSVVEETLALLASRAHAKRLELACDFDPALDGRRRGDPGRIRQVLTNLVGNAIKFTEQGEVVTTIGRGPAGPPGSASVRITIRDTGIGIPPEAQSRLFQPFTQVDGTSTRRFGGTGLGLAISRQLVELMGGRMWAESVTGEGSTFHFTINLSVPDGAAPPKHAKRQLQLAGLKILILEDNATTRNLLFEQCRRWGMQPQAVENSAQAMDLFRKGMTFDLALVDAALPGIDGATVATEMQKFPAATLMPVILLTSVGKKSDEENGARVMFAHTVNKPVKPAQLCTVLERALLSPRIPSGATEPAKAEVALATRLPLRVLIVDDNAINQKVAVRILQQFGYEPAIAANGREALEAIEHEPFDLIFMDVMMPEMDGLEATRQIRKRQMNGEQQHFQSRIIICAMTAHAMAGDREKCMGAGMDDYLAKPVRPKDVRDMIEKWGGKIALDSGAPREAAKAEAAADAPVDLARMNDLTDGNLDNLRELVEMYFTQTQKQFVEMREAIRDGKADAVRRVAHSCAGASATMGMTHLVPCLRELEKLGASGTLTGAEPICETAATEFERIREFLKAQPELTRVITNLNPA